METDAPTTLPLFGNGEQRPAKHDTPKPMSAREHVLHVYWSAGVEAQALAFGAATCRYPSERRALASLQRLELQRKEAARRFLDEVWQIKLPDGASLAALTA
jgi:hypothetical protein